MNKLSKRLFPLVLVSVMLPGCQPSGSDGNPCRDDCRLTISLPGDSALPPEVSQTDYHVTGGADLEVVVRGGPAGRGESALRFEARRHALTTGGGQPMEIVLLNHGSNRYRVRPFDHGFCHPPIGCKYTIANTGNPDRPEVDAHLIIHPR